MGFSIRTFSEIVIALALSFVVFSAFAEGTTVYVSTMGMDADGRGDETHPFKTVKFAVESLGTVGGVVYVNPGLYQQAVQTTITAPIRVLGTTGNPEDVTLQNTSGMQKDRIFWLEHEKAFVANMTFLDGGGSPVDNAYNYHFGGGVLIRSAGGSVSNCVFRNGYSLHFESYGAGVYLSNGLVTHCKFTGNFSTCPAYNADPTAKGVVIHCDGVNARVENCLIYDAHAVSVDDGASHGPIVAIVKGTMRNCTVVPNFTLFNTTSTYVNYLKWNTDGGCAIRCSSGGLVENCAVAGLKNINGDLKPFGGTMANFYNCVGDGDMDLTGSHNCVHATQEEMFLDPESKDYRPKARGALVNIAIDVPGYGNLIDLAGVNRVVKILDVGCYESQFVPGLVITGKRVDD